MAAKSYDNCILSTYITKVYLPRQFLKNSVSILVSNMCGSKEDTIIPTYQWRSVIDTVLELLVCKVKQSGMIELHI